MEELQELINSEEYDFRFDLGIAIPVNKIRLQDKELLVSSMAKHFTVLKVKGELDQIICGMSSTMNVLELVRSNSNLTRSLFLFSKCPPLTADAIFDMFEVTLSPIGHNQRDCEEAVMMNWAELTQFLESKSSESNYNHLIILHINFVYTDAQGSVEIKTPDEGELLRLKLTLSDVLMFVTGAPFEPPLGFTPQPSIQFHSPVFPKANTCINKLYLPLQEMDFELFKYNMISGILNSPGCGQV